MGAPTCASAGVMAPFKKRSIPSTEKTCRIRVMFSYVHEEFPRPAFNWDSGTHARLFTMLVMKFGGTSVGAVEQIQTAARIVESVVPSKPIVILSAMAGVTDGLLTAGLTAVQGMTRERDDKLWEIRSKHDRVINDLFKERRAAAEIQETLRPIWEEMQKVFTG